MLAPAGKVRALVGPSDAGKSTVLSLIPRFFDVDGGGVRIGGRDLRGLTVTSLRAAIAVVGQEVVLFDDTVAENIRYGRAGASDDEVREIGRAAGRERVCQYVWISVVAVSLKKKKKKTKK